MFSVQGESDLLISLLDQNAREIFAEDSKDVLVHRSARVKRERLQGYVQSVDAKDRSRSQSTTMPPFVATELSSLQDNVSDWGATLNLADSMSEHSQWIRSTLVDHENLIVDASNKLDCRVDQLKVFELIVLSRFSGILAARAFGLQSCQSMETFERHAVIRQCRTVSAEFVVAGTRCGAQPKFENFTIARDGWTLVPFTPCYWQSAVVNFNGEAYSARDGLRVWEKPVREAKHKVLLAKFRQSVDLSGSLLTAGLEREHSWQFHLLSELAGSLDENGVSSVGEVVESVARAGKVPAIVVWLRALKWTQFAVIGTAMLAGVVYFIVRFRTPIMMLIGGIFRRVWNRCKRKPSTVVRGETARVIGVGAPEEGEEVIELYPNRAESPHLPSHYHVLSSQDGNPG